MVSAEREKLASTVWGGGIRIRIAVMIYSSIGPTVFHCCTTGATGSVSQNAGLPCRAEIYFISFHLRYRANEYPHPQVTSLSPSPGQEERATRPAPKPGSAPLDRIYIDRGRGRMVGPCKKRCGFPVLQSSFNSHFDHSLQYRDRGPAPIYICES